MLYATTPADPSHHVERNTDQSNRDSNTPFTNLSTSPYASHQNQDSPYSQFTAPAPAPAPAPYPEIDDNVLHVCITCRKIYKDKYGLAKHRREKCESQGVWVCHLCPHRCGRKEKLKDHFKIHVRKCGTDCEFRNEEPCPKHHLSLDLDAAYREYPPKKAWACPLCESCFDTGDEWHEHEKTHFKDVRAQERRDANVPVEGWSERQLIESLLKSKYLRGAVRLIPSDSWKSCRWPGEKEDLEAFSNLIFALERHALLENLEGFTATDELANYAFQIGISWNPNLADNTAPWPQKPAVYPGIATCLTSGSSVMSSSGQRHATGLMRSQAAGNSAYQPNQAQINVMAMQARQLQELSFQSFDTAPDTGHSTQPERQRPITPRPLQEPQRLKGLFSPVKNLMRSKSNASRIQEVSSPNLQPSCPPILPTQQPQVTPGFPLRQDPLAWISYETSSRTTTQKNETPLHGEKRSSLMSLDMTRPTDTEQQQPRSTPAGLVGSETAVTFFDLTSIYDDGGYSFIFDEYMELSAEKEP
jgi:hypothetical protein